MDTAEARRAKATLYPDVTCPEGVTFTRAYFETKQGFTLSYIDYRPKSAPASTTLFVIHGYANSTLWFHHVRNLRYASEGYRVVAVDLLGHGCSDGLFLHIPDFQALVDGVAEVCRDVSKPENTFLIGESLGGAVALWMVLQQGQAESLFRGCVLFCPMCRIADEVKPNPIAVSVLTSLGAVFPTAPVVPTPDLTDLSLKHEGLRQVWKQNPIYRAMKPRIATALQMKRATDYIEQEMEKVKLPMLILHGEEDKVVSPQVSKELFARSSSTDKTLKLYPGQWHNLLDCVTEEEAQVVWNDLLGWLKNHQ